MAMKEEGIAKALIIISGMKGAAAKMEKADEKGDRDTVLEMKKEIMDLQKQLSAAI